MKQGMKKLSNMSPQDMYKYARQIYDIYQFLNGAKKSDKFLNDFFSKSGIDQNNFYKFLTEQNINQIYNSLNDDQKKQFNMLLNNLKINFNKPVDSDDNPVNLDDEPINSDDTHVEQDDTEINSQGGNSKRRRSKRKRSKRRRSRK